MNKKGQAWLWILAAIIIIVAILIMLNLSKKPVEIKQAPDVDVPETSDVVEILPEDVPEIEDTDAPIPQVIIVSGGSSGGSSGGTSSGSSGGSSDSSDEVDVPVVPDVDDCNPNAKDPCKGKCMGNSYCLVEDVGAIPETIYTCSCQVPEPKCSLESNDPCSGECSKDECLIEDVGVLPGTIYSCSCPEPEPVCSPESENPCGDECSKDECNVKDVGAVPGLVYTCSCPSPEDSYTESDNGLDYENYGTCYDGTNYGDSCNGDVLKEWYLADIDGNGLSCWYTNKECSSLGDYICDDGKCKFVGVPEGMSCDEFCPTKGYSFGMTPQSELECGAYINAPGVVYTEYYPGCCCYETSCTDYCAGFGFEEGMAVENEQECDQFVTEPDVKSNNYNYYGDCCCHETVEMVDTDNGANLVVKGYCEDGDGKLEDYCVGNQLFEALLGDGCYYATVQCADGYECSNGACHLIDYDQECKDYCLSLSRSAFTGGDCYGGQSKMSNEALCSVNNGIYKTSSEGVCGSDVCCCR